MYDFDGDKKIEGSGFTLRLELERVKVGLANYLQANNDEVNDAVNEAFDSFDFKKAIGRAVERGVNEAVNSFFLPGGDGYIEIKKASDEMCQSIISGNITHRD